jgi:hypothetical protein
MTLVVGVAVAAAAADGAAADPFTATGDCGNGAGPICYTEASCVEWAFAVLPFPPFLWPYCAKYEITETRYWENHGGPDSGGGAEGGEEAPVQPEEG